MAVAGSRAPPLFSSLILTFFVSIFASSESELLLEFKSSVVDPANHLSDWSNSASSEVCNWTGVACVTASVASIVLRRLNLSGEISPALCRLPSLTHLDLSDNAFNQPIPLHLSNCASVLTLNLSGNLIWGTIPDQISQLSSLQELDLSRNHVEGELPGTLGGLRRLRVLNFGSNLLSGELPPLFGNFTDLVTLDMSENPLLAGNIADSIGAMSKLEDLSFKRCGLQGFIPESLMNLRALRTLDLSQNNLTGILPDSGHQNGLVSFDVSQNRIHGPFPAGICAGGKLAGLSLHGNAFNGSISGSIRRCLSLQTLEVQNNAFSGDFPREIWLLPRIKIIRAENNELSGRIPATISSAYYLEQVQIDGNNFSGEIPRTFGSSLYRFSASSNGFHGDLSPDLCNDSPLMSIVNLSRNSMSGIIPELRNCRKLVSLSLAGNVFSGQIPRSLADLPVLTYLDLSSNNLTGSIPEELGNLNFALFDVSFNHLSGKVPSSLTSGLPASFLNGNPQLCFSGSCSDEKGRRNPRAEFLGLSKIAFVAIVVLFSLLVLSAFLGFVAMRQSSKTRRRRQQFVFYYPLRIKEEDLLTAVLEDGGLPASSLHGSVHVLSLPSGELVAVKRLIDFHRQSSTSMRKETRVFANITHKNIVKLLGHYQSDDSILLIREYVRNGSLEDLANRSDFQFHWDLRMKIAIGVARGIAYLHNDCVPHLLHMNLKPSNVLLDAEMEPRLTDFSLSKIIGERAFRSVTDAESSWSYYVAPESRFSQKPNEWMDVYSFGVLLLELVTGRISAEAKSEDSVDVVKFVRRKINIENGAIQVLDRKISRCFKEEMLQALEIALRCTSVVPEKRPLMLENVRELQIIASRRKSSASTKTSLSADRLP